MNSQQHRDSCMESSVAIYYLKGMAVKRDVGRAIALLESIAEKEPTAKANLGHIYLEGQGYTERYRVTQTGCGFR